MLTVDFRRLEAVLAKRPGGPPIRVLDIGCGSGRHLCKAAEFDGVFAVGTDRDPAELLTARQRWTEHRGLISCGGGVGMVAADIRRLPFRNGTFDLTLCSEVLEHIPDHRAAAGELARVTRRSGPVVVSVPRYLPERVCWLLSRDYHANPGGHIRIYTRKELCRLLERAGLVPWDRHFAHALHSLFWWLKCWVEEGGGHRGGRLVDCYHRILVWDMMAQPRLTRWLERLLNPLLGKSLVLYLRKRSA